MDSLSWMAALALMAAPGTPPAQGKNPSPARESVPPTQRAEDTPAHESPYSAFSAPHAKRKVNKRSGARLHCADGTIQTRGPKGADDACADHGGVKQKK